MTAKIVISKSEKLNQKKNEGDVADESNLI